MLDQGIVDELKKRAASGDASVLSSPEMRSLFDVIKTMPDDQKRDYGQAVNSLRTDIQDLLNENKHHIELEPIDVTAPWQINAGPASRPVLGQSVDGSTHPMTQELDYLLSIFTKMGFSVAESRQIDDDYHMFTSLNFPKDHPARDDYDTFTTKEGLVAPAHTSTMQNRILKENSDLLAKGQPIAYVIPGRVFRNEDLDATHEHTFHQLEGLYVDKKVSIGMLVSTLKTYLNAYFNEDLEVKLQPFYFPFTEPSFELALERPSILRKDDSEEQKWLELLGCGMIHPNVLSAAGIDPTVYSGFAWGQGVERMVMMKHGIEDIRLFNSAKLDFLRQF